MQWTSANPGFPRATSTKRLERMVAVLSAVNDHGSVTLAELAEDLGMSAATIRRDLADLAAQNLLIRTHGGAQQLGGLTELPMRLKDPQRREAKQLIAKKTAQLLPTGPYAIAISGGTTTAEVAKALVSHSNLTIVTNSLTTAMEIAAQPSLSVIVTGGRVRSSSYELVGSLAENIFGAINVGTAILGTDGFTAGGGATTHDDAEARTGSAMVRHAQHVIVVADGTKIGRITLAKVADISQIHELVTDSTADPDELARIADAGVRIHIVDSPDS